MNMERNAEYLLLKEELNHTPNDLEFALGRACARLRQKKRLRMFTVPARAILVLVVAFVLLVNLSWSFALACSRLPVLSDLAAVVAVSPSLKAAVENGYMQRIGEEQTQHGITMRVEYVVADEKQLNVFYTLQSEPQKNFSVDAQVGADDGKNLQGFSINSEGYVPSDGTLHKLCVDFVEGDMPGRLSLSCHLFESKGTSASDAPVAATAVADYSFELVFDPSIVRIGEVVQVNQNIILDGQTFEITTVEIYPTSMYVNLDAAQTNTAWLKGLKLYAEDENGNRYESMADGITALAEEGSPDMRAFRLESSFFSSGKELTLHITGALWLDKSIQDAKVDAENGTAPHRPVGIDFLGASSGENAWTFRFSVPEVSAVTICTVCEWSPSASKIVPLTISYVTVTEDEQNGTETQTYTVLNSKDGMVYFVPAVNRTSKEQMPVTIKLK